MFSAGSTMNTGSKKLQREVASTFCGARPVRSQSLPPSWLKNRGLVDEGFAN
jgi:hypothetical protein